MIDGAVGLIVARRWTGRLLGQGLLGAVLVWAGAATAGADAQQPVAGTADEVVRLRTALAEALTLSAADAPPAEAVAEAPHGLDVVDDADDEGGLGVSLDLAFNSKYVWRGLRLTDDPVVQPSISLTWQGLTVSVWGNMDLTGVNGNRGDFNEVDVSVDYSMSLVGPLGGSVGMVFYTFPNTEFNSTTEFYAGLNLDVPLSPSVTAYFDVDEVDGAYVTADIGHSVQLPSRVEGVSWSLDLSLGFGWGSGKHNLFYYGSRGGAWADFHSSVGLPIRLGDRLTVTPSVGYHSLLDSNLRAGISGDDTVVYGVSVTLDF